MSLDLALALAPVDTAAAVSSAVVADVAADGTVTIDLGGSRLIPRTRVLSTYSPVTGDGVEVVRRDANSFLVVGAVRTSAPTTVEVSDSIGLAWDVLPAYGEAAASGQLIVNATDTQSYRTSDKWARDDVYQGALSSSTSYGYNRGCYFYGTAFAALIGKRCTGLQVRVSRKNAGGPSAAADVYIAPHAHTTRPTGSPIWRAPALKVGAVALGAYAYLDLPVPWGQGLIDGTIRGLGHLRDTTGDYAVFNSLAADAWSGTLVLDWSN